MKHLCTGFLLLPKIKFSFILIWLTLTRFTLNQPGELPPHLFAADLILSEPTKGDESAKSTSYRIINVFYRHPSGSS